MRTVWRFAHQHARTASTGRRPGQFQCGGAADRDDGHVETATGQLAQLPEHLHAAAVDHRGRAECGRQFGPAG